VANPGAFYFAVTLERRSSFFDLSPQQGNYEGRCERDCDHCESQHIEHGLSPFGQAGTGPGKSRNETVFWQLSRGAQDVDLQNGGFLCKR
jgi:hypothetical protein